MAVLASLPVASTLLVVNWPEVAWSLVVEVGTVTIVVLSEPVPVVVLPAALLMVPVFALLLGMEDLPKGEVVAVPIELDVPVVVVTRVEVRVPGVVEKDVLVV